MNFPDTCEVLRPQGSDAYGNDLADFSDPLVIEQKCFHVIQGRQILMPRSADIQQGDRVRIDGETYAADADPIRSPSALKLYMLKLTRLED
ncbi:hypothetical protein HPO96_36970 [Kribbella sandramycini]|uniref:Head-tail joining protein n=1 Tax=Kribbella sandramycini TaxID=60450 RepID=A0A7Y4L9P7_9ACTN|nr:hypothetical protein [Kribbella sandramycini]MBB6564389.1 hypothetical protein [Kribbella sandramycini]NOL45852.1 hypothetical protein [Kribbella sandramycini]